LDEPTNHLDMDSREVLEDALADFPGTILAISHDRYFINRFADKVMVMSDNGVTEYLGNFDDYIEKRNRPKPPVSTGDEVTRTAQIKEKKKNRQQSAILRELKQAVRKAEEAIEQNEQELARLEAALADPATYNDMERMRQLTEAYQQEQDKTEALYEALENAENALTEADA
ncbi:MAG: ABC-F family ATP-binding cassette domain-containing protein, partial [Clostridia bacterium]|nr:ABC-F family ATP-binding cassette domain-containing protein [Clostridia bacterium]